MTTLELMTGLGKVIGSYRWSLNTEAELQEAMGRVLALWPHLREVVLSETERIDFLVGTVGLELKVDGSRADVLRQLSRYAECPEIEGLILATTRSRHRNLPATLNGKPLAVIFLGSPA